ncbi:sulfite exporter TauE/SafE family protein [Polynucleobacter sp. AP-Melu-500A-A1]|uniref:sulfite exporter TauE/SafE family protein n=1 Tax=Polynucleobacter sp. AP-Melu-500A-A1 TaxID=2576929 RepID=UPI001C0BC637|nr:sulfite exporter TauE/SafE family protein [Polynucleobacter sp. AP-Melu-500A-A1]MBU3631374.1 sulfite exporter TauE/SafE family protein [Polynucleobacter sp. AP-Melu-500A-A1]
MDYTILISPALGIFVGILMGLTGAGGGILSVPLLVFALHLSVAEAAPIALSAIALAAGIGALLGLQTKILRYKAAGFMAMFGLLLSPIGLWLAQRLPNNPLLILFSCTLFYVSTRLYMQARNEILGIKPAVRKPPPCLLHPVHGKLDWNLPCAKALLLSGGLAGFLSGLLGVGGGFVIVPALKRYTDLPVKSIVATSLGALAIISGGGTIVSMATGNFDYLIAAPFAFGALGGLLIGRAFGKKLSGPRLQQIFAVLTFAVAISLMLKGLTN